MSSILDSFFTFVTIFAPLFPLRYALLAYVLCLRRFSEALEEEFPDSEALFSAGLATRKELQLLESEADLGRVWHVPISWAMIMIRRLATFDLYSNLWLPRQSEAMFRTCFS